MLGGWPSGILGIYRTLQTSLEGESYYVSLLLSVISHSTELSRLCYSGDFSEVEIVRHPIGRYWEYTGYREGSASDNDLLTSRQFDFSVSVSSKERSHSLTSNSNLLFYYQLHLFKKVTQGKTQGDSLDAVEPRRPYCPVSSFLPSRSWVSGSRSVSPAPTLPTPRRDISTRSVPCHTKREQHILQCSVASPK